MRIFLKFVVLFYFVVPQLVFGANDVRQQLRNATKKCGSPGDGIRSRIVGGDAFERGDLPWMVALTKNVENQAPDFFCTGTLVSFRHVITGNDQSQIFQFLVINFLKYSVFFLLIAAHCIRNKDEHSQLLARELIALFGVHNLDNGYEAGRIALTPTKLDVHPDWNSSDMRYDAEIAIMTFGSGEIPSTKFIQPICLWNGDASPPETEGCVGAWGLNQKSGEKHEKIPSKLKVSIHTNEFCFLTTKDLVNTTSDQTFCVSKADETGICRIDSGGGVSIIVGSSFYFRGIVSTTLNDQTSCDVLKFPIFTDVLKFKPWIDQIMSKDDGKILIQKVVQTNLECTIEPYLWINYQENKPLLTCYIYKQNIDEEGFSVAVDPNLSIQAFSIEDIEEVEFLPESVAESFPGLIVYHVLRCSIKTVNGKHFKGLNNLSGLELQQNEIEAIDGDSFKDLTKLEKLNLGQNKIKTIDPNWFKSLGTLWGFYIDDNQIEYLDEKIFDNLTNLKKIGLDRNKLTKIPANLLKNNLKLEGIRLRANKIHTISSTMFNRLHRLIFVNLKDNVCVNYAFMITQFRKMENVLRTNCESPI